MAIINFARREIEAKVVYYGPALSGKTTNVQQAHGRLPDELRGDLHTISTEDERTLFFDYAPITRGQIAGFVAKFKLFSVPGQVFYKETRRIVLQGADAVVFVADSSPDRAQANIDSLIDLEENLRSHGLDLSSIPLVIQFNKRDVAGARSVQAMNTDLNPFGVPIVESVAYTGDGVVETLEAVTDIAASRIRDNLAGRRTAVALTAIDSRDAEEDEAVIRRHLKEIEEVRPQEEARGREMVEQGVVDPGEVDAFLLQNVERASEYLGDEEAPSEDEDVKDEPTWNRNPRVPDLPPGPIVELGFLPSSLEGFKATRIVAATPTPKGGVKMDLLMEATEGGGVSRCTVNLRPESAYTRGGKTPVRTGSHARPRRSNASNASGGGYELPQILAVAIPAGFLLMTFGVVVAVVVLRLLT